MTKEEIIEKISSDDVLPYIEPWALKEIVEFVIKNSKPAFPSNLNEAAEEYSVTNRPSIMGDLDICDAFKAGAEWMAGQGRAEQ